MSQYRYRRLIKYLPTFSKRNVVEFLSCLRLLKTSKISGNFPKTSQRWQKCPNNLFKSISEAILEATILACRADTFRTQSQH